MYFVSCILFAAITSKHHLFSNLMDAVSRPLWSRPRIHTVPQCMMDAMPVPRVTGYHPALERRAAGWSSPSGTGASISHGEGNRGWMCSPLKGRNAHSYHRNPRGWGWECAWREEWALPLTPVRIPGKGCCWRIPHLYAPLKWNPQPNLAKNRMTENPTYEPQWET